jgi:hypothetical protein
LGAGNAAYLPLQRSAATVLPPPASAFERGVLPSAPFEAHARRWFLGDLRAPEIVAWGVNDFRLEQGARGFPGLAARQADQRPKRVHRHTHMDFALVLDERTQKIRAGRAIGCFLERLRKHPEPLFDPGNDDERAASSRPELGPQAPGAQLERPVLDCCFGLHAAMIRLGVHRAVIAW